MWEVFGPFHGRPTAIKVAIFSQCKMSLVADTVAKVVLHWWSKILRAADAFFV
jgi:hypothetical protein